MIYRGILRTLCRKQLHLFANAIFFLKNIGVIGARIDFGCEIFSAWSL